MANYLIIGGDGKEYGPVTDADVRQWIAEGRLAPSSQAKAESDAEFRALAQFPEFAEAFGLSAPGTIAPPPRREADLLQRDYELDLGGCISQGWNLVKGHMSPLFVAALLYLLIEGAVGGLAGLPFIGPIFSIANFVCSGPLMGGLFYLFIRVNRSEPAEIGELFSGFRRAFGQLFLGVFVPGLVVGLCMIPFVIVLIIKLVPLAGQLQHFHAGQTPDPETVAAIKSIFFAALPVALVCALPATYLSVCWKFTLPLIVDRQMDFGAAMKLSWKKVNQHWWQVFGLIILIGLLNVAGLLACCVGILFTLPVGFAALMIAYETIFGETKN
jgi:Membrane domain of glycerophosphoryl diester phosphodiesterase/GYF domain 2